MLKRVLLIMALSVSCISVFGQGSSLKSYQWSAVDSSGKRFTEREFWNRTAPWEKDVIKTVKPEYPFEERRRKHAGFGLFRMEIDLKTGSVRHVTVVKSTGYNRLDEAAKNASAGWRFQPNSWREVNLPVNFVLPSQVGYR